MNGRTNSSFNVSNSLGSEIPLDPVTSFLCEARNSQVDITWTDPKDKYATPEGEQMEDTDQLVSQWAYTKIVRKENTQPNGPNDGVTVYTETVRNEHQSTIFKDTGVTNGLTYYYAAYAYNTAGDCSEGVFSEGVTPIEWSSVLAENSWEQIDSACTQGVAQSLWSIGDEIDITVLGEALTCVILDFNRDNLTEGGKATITFGTKGLLSINCPVHYNSATNGWRSPVNYFDESDESYYNWMSITVEPSIIAHIGIYLRQVSKRATSTTTEGESYYRTISKDVYAFPFAISELTSEYNQVNDGPLYSYHSTISNAIRRYPNGSAEDYPTRNSGYNTGTHNYLVYQMLDQGNISNTVTAISGGLIDFAVAFAFCVGKQSAV